MNPDAFDHTPRSFDIAARRSLRALYVERLTNAFWPLLSWVLFSFAALRFDVWAFWPWAIVSGVGFVVCLGLGARRFQRPGLAQAWQRLDQDAPHHPIAARYDDLPNGADPQTTAIWQAYQVRMQAKLAQLQPRPPIIRLAQSDPVGLRLIALTAALLALVFGAWPTLNTSSETQAAPKAVWEGWAEAPDYTGSPPVYLNDIAGDILDLPEGSIVVFRFYGRDGAFDVTTGVGVIDLGEQGAEIKVNEPGLLRLDGPGGRQWQIQIVADAEPSVTLHPAADRQANGMFQHGFNAEDDYGISVVNAQISLDLARISRRHGLVAAPDPRPDVITDIPLPVTGTRKHIESALVEDFSKHPWADLPVTLTLTVTDEAGQSAWAQQALYLQGKRFFHPVAAALSEQRRDLLWARTNAARVAQMLRALTWQPDDQFDNPAGFMMLRLALHRLEGYGDTLREDQQEEVAEMLWQAALRFEDGALATARQRLQRAQDRLSEAMRNGASPDEIDALMQELRQAMQAYMRALAQEQQGQPEQDLANTQGITADQLGQIMDRIQDLMEQGRMAEAQQLMQQLQKMMENMRMTQGGNGGQGAMEGLADTLRQQQNLSDDAFEDMQEQFQGQAGGNQGLADRQDALRRDLQDQRNGLPGAGTPEGEAARRDLDCAAEAMRQAEEALRGGEPSVALDQQAEAMEALRNALRNMGQMQQPGQPPTGQAGRNGQPQRDPLGREAGETGQLGGEDALLDGPDARRRALELLQELRRRSGEDRPTQELEYLKRLLGPF
jgi:uncharacterized protein (TIGR02302 family)